MNTTFELSHTLDYSPLEHTLLDEIREWIDSNMLMADQHFVWNIGITTSTELIRVAGKIRGDNACKHLKYWNAETFKNAMGIVSRLNRYPFIFKSSLNKYIGKGRYIFVYKTTCDSKSLFYHTFHH